MQQVDDGDMRLLIPCQGFVASSREAGTFVRRMVRRNGNMFLREAFCIITLRERIRLRRLIYMFLASLFVPPSARDSSGPGTKWGK